jgi:hypothetical protein
LVDFATFIEQFRSNQKTSEKTLEVQKLSAELQADLVSSTIDLKDILEDHLTNLREIISYANHKIDETDKKDKSTKRKDNKDSKDNKDNKKETTLRELVQEEIVEASERIRKSL